MIKECKYCNKNIEDLPGYKKGAHIRNCKVIKLKLIKKNHPERKDYIFNCKKCSKEYTLNLTEKEFDKNGFRKNCSRSCANGRKLSNKIIKEKQSKIKTPTIQYNLICKNCNKEFIYRNNKKLGCCRKCTIQYKMSTGELIDYGKKGGQNSAKTQFERRRSKNEIYFYELCFKHFVNIENNKAIFNNWMLTLLYTI